MQNEDDWLLVAAEGCIVSPAPPWPLVRPACPPCHTCCLAASSQRPHLHAEKVKEKAVFLLYIYI